MKKYIKGLLVIVFLLSVVSAHAYYDFTATNNEGVTIYYSYVSQDNLTIEVANNSSTSATANGTYSGVVNIPETVDYDGKTYTVVGVGQYAFRQCTNLTEVTLPSGVTYINLYGFYMCNALTEFALPSNLTSIGNYAFYNCTKLEDIVLPSSLTTIGEYAFTSCSALTAIAIPDALTAMGQYAFQQCSNLAKVTLGTGLTEIPRYAFSQSGVEEIVIPSGVTTIGDYSFQNCPNLTTVTLSETVTTLGKSCFGGRSYPKAFFLESLTSLALTPPECGDYAFQYGPGSCVLYVFKEAVEEYSSAPTWQDFSTILEIEEADEDGVFEVDNIYYKVLSTDDYTVEVVSPTGGEPYKGTVSLPTTVTFNYVDYTVCSVGATAFANSTSLTDVSLSASITAIGDRAFDGCTALERVISLNTTPPALGEYVFESVPTTACLIVERVAMDAYAADNQWGAFTTTMALNPLVITSAEVQDITRDSATLSATYEAGYNATMEMGFEFWSTADNVRTAATEEDNGTLTATLTALNAGTLYTYRAYARTAMAVIYGDTYTFTTEHIPPTATTAEPSSITSTTAVVNGKVEKGTEEIVAQGFVYYATAGEELTAEGDINEENNISATLTSLHYNTQYTYYVFVTTPSATYTGATMTFFTPTDAPVVTTYEAVNVSDTSALISGYVKKGSEDIAEQGFEYWAGDYDAETVQKITYIDEMMALTLTNLSPFTTYTYRAYATTEIYGITYGGNMEFTTLEDTTTGINGIRISIDDENVEGIYSTSGQKLNSTQAGVNIIRYMDGTIKKVFF